MRCCWQDGRSRRDNNISRDNSLNLSALISLIFCSIVSGADKLLKRTRLLS